MYMQVCALGIWDLSSGFDLDLDVKNLHLWGLWYCTVLYRSVILGCGIQCTVLVITGFCWLILQDY